MDKRIENLFKVSKFDNLVLSLNKLNPNETLPDMLGGITMKHIKGIHSSKNPEEYVKEHFPEKINTSRYEMLQLFFNLDDYNKVYQYFNCNPHVFTWDIEAVRVLARRPPNMINSICDETYPNVYSVMSFFPNLDKNECFKGFSPDTIWHVRKYLETEDENELQTSFNPKEVKKLLGHLEHLGLVEKLKDSDIYVAVHNDNSRRPRKRSRLAISGEFTIEEILKNIFPSFEAFDLANKNKNILKKLQREKNVTKITLNINEIVIKPGASNTIFIVFRKTAFYDFECYRFGTDTLERKIREINKNTKVCLVFNTKQSFDMIKRSKHPLLTNVTKLCAIYHYLRIVSGHEQLNLFKAIYFSNKKI